MNAPTQASNAPLPTPLSRLIGRQREIDEIHTLLLQPHVRLLTLTGPGGVGKTRLAIAAGAAVAETRSTPVSFVPLAAIADHTLVGPAIVSALGLREIAGLEPAERLLGFFGDRKRLLVLDNFEQVAEASSLVVSLLSGCPELTILITSRTPLHLSGEQDYLVEPLSVPDDGRLPAIEQLMQIDAIALVVQRARERRAGFELTTANAAAVAAICRQLDGLPLALELAAARIGLLTPQVMAERIEQRLTLLTGGPRDQPARHQTLRATIAWSHELLSPAQQRLFEQLGVFSGGWTLEAAESICVSHEDFLGGLEALSDHHLVRQFEQPDGSTRFGMLELIREYALEQLAASGERDMLHERHAAFFASLAARLLPYPPAGLDLAARADRLDAELDNLRAAMIWRLENVPTAALRMAVDLESFWLIRGSFSEGRRWVDDGLAQARNPGAGLHAEAQVAIAGLAVWQGDYDVVLRLSDEALRAFEKIGDERGVYRALFCSARVAWFTGDLERSVELFERSAAMQLAAGDWFGVAGSIGNLGGIAQQQGDLLRATRLMEEALALTRAHDFVSQSAIWLSNLGTVMLQGGEHDLARAHFTECLVLERLLRGRRIAADSLDGLALLASREGQPELATTLYGAVTALREEFGIPRRDIDRDALEIVLVELVATLSAEPYAVAWAVGRSMSLNEAIAYALDPPATPSAIARATDPAPSPLSKRELDVLRLVAQGKTDREIGAELFISHHTVMHHVSRILNKLDVESRTAAATWAVKHGVI